MKKIFKDMCECCHEWKSDCHGYGDALYCPDCAKKLGYDEWHRRKATPEELAELYKRKGVKMEDIQTTPVEAKNTDDEKTFENGTKAVTVKKVTEGIRVRFFENGNLVNEKTYESNTGVYKAKKKWLGC